MTYTLYGSPGTASFCVHWMLIELDVPFTFHALDFEKGEQRAPDYLKLNPTGHVPTLVMDGVAYGEAGALLSLLAERHPATNFAPAPGTPERGLYLQWMFYLADTLMPAFRLFYYPVEGAGPGQEEATKAQAVIRVERVLARADALLSDGRSHLLGNRMTAADFLLGMLARWSRNLPKTAFDWPHLGAYVRRLRAMPSYQQTHRREGLSGWI
ncbi:MAG: glutathione S-transferase family protein [Alphaproteobacteria bacterium]|nr:glutathione S-transferase family protein [Alphaproteobacteria bacterium]